MKRKQETGKPGANLAMITAAVTIAVSMQAMDTHVASVALPAIRGAMSATPDEVSWILTASLISIAAGFAAIEKTVLQQAKVLAYIQDFWLPTFIALAMVPMALLLRTRRAQPAE